MNLFQDMVVTAPERCPETVLRSLNDRLVKSQCSERGVGGSLELLRLNLQSSFDEEVAGIVNKYKEKFFLKAVENLKGNLGDQEVSENDVRTKEELVIPTKGHLTIPSPFSSFRCSRKWSNRVPLSSTIIHSTSRTRCSPPLILVPCSTSATARRVPKTRRRCPCSTRHSKSSRRSPCGNIPRRSRSRPRKENARHNRRPAAVKVHQPWRPRNNKRRRRGRHQRQRPFPRRPPPPRHRSISSTRH